MYLHRASNRHEKQSGDISGATGGSQQINFGGDSAAEQNYREFRNWVYVFIKAICTRLSGQEYQVGQVIGAEANPERRAKPGMSKAQRATLPSFLKSAHQELEIFESHPLLDLLNRPNQLQGKAEFLSLSITNLYLTGQAYFLRDGFEKNDGEVSEIWAIPTSWVAPQHDGKPFSSYKIKFGSMATAVDVPPEAVQRIYFPDPSGVSEAYSPVAAAITPIRTDNLIQSSQEKMFENGIFPRLVLRAARMPSQDGSTEQQRRFVLTSAQRKHLTFTIRQLWKGVANYGDPPIIDGMIDDITKLSNSPAEMDWLQSGAQVKARIAQAFGVNPIVVGEITGVNRAQATVADQMFCDGVINPLIGMLSIALTEFLGPEFDQELRIKIWLELCVALDAEMSLKKHDTARKNGDINRDEYRAFMGLPPGEEPERSKILDNPQTITSVSNIIQQVNLGTMGPDQAAALLALSLQIEPEQAALLVSGKNATAITKSKSIAPHRLTRQDVKDISLIQQGTAETRVIAAADRLLSQQIRSIVAGLRKLKANTSSRKNADQQATVLIDSVFNAREWDEKLTDEFVPVTGRLIVEGALAELTIHEMVLGGKAVDLPGDIFGDIPDWLNDAASAELRKIFAQPYWAKINVTTRDDVHRLLRRGILDGSSIGDMATEIADRFGSTYTRPRGLMIARTESGAALNAGHTAGIARVEAETGVVTGKEWLSVLGTTTRDTHAAIDGAQVRSADGLFTLGGVDVPYPAHFSLPVGDRVNCQCTVIATTVADELE